MQEVCGTNDLVKLSYIEALLKNAGIPYQIFDEHFSAVEGTLAPFPRRVLVDPAHAAEASRILNDAGIDC
jgi:hypothetical protein